MNEENTDISVTKEKVLEDIRASKEEFAASEGQDAKDALRDIRKEFRL